MAQVVFWPESSDEVERAYSGFPVRESLYVKHWLRAKAAIRSRLGTRAGELLERLPTAAWGALVEYDYWGNAVVVSLATLQEPLFSRNVTQAINYAGLGTMFASALVQAFDARAVVSIIILSLIGHFSIHCNEIMRKNISFDPEFMAFLQKTHNLLWYVDVPHDADIASILSNILVSCTPQQLIQDAPPPVLRNAPTLAVESGCGDLSVSQLIRSMETGEDLEDVLENEPALSSTLNTVDTELLVVAPLSHEQQGPETSSTAASVPSQLPSELCPAQSGAAAAKPAASRKRV
ncbi:hypothetical protein HPB49_008325 [Dermacentor silvarum]|uniref:Uncharacterized protein n=1 Tax=Dermacentor silvarum TaxID=543639 RepID=A0ACB8D3Z3_DERSI|nr:hypothetical protein HPB49_008325 [Dermacentor silvarum]